MNIIYFDGACGPYNPGGHMGCGVIIKDKDNNTIHTIKKQYSPDEFSGNTSNNVAEYLALILALEWCIKYNVLDIQVYGDSKLVINQMTGVFKIKNGAYVPHAIKAQNLIKNFSSVSFKHVKRELNNEADELSGIIIDGYNSKTDNMRFIKKKPKSKTLGVKNKKPPKPQRTKVKPLKHKDSTNPEKIAEYQKKYQELMNQSEPKRYEDMTPEERGASRHIKREGHKRRETKGKPNTFGLTSNNRNTKKNPPKGGWV